QFSAWPNGALGLPQRRSTVVAKRIQGADVGQRDDLVSPDPGARDEIVERREPTATAARIVGRRPVVGTVVTEPANGSREFSVAVDALDHRLVVAAAFGAESLG